jgi:hypothetical protein
LNYHELQNGHYGPTKKSFIHGQPIEKVGTQRPCMTDSWIRPNSYDSSVGKLDFAHENELAAWHFTSRAHDHMLEGMTKQ